MRPLRLDLHGFTVFREPTTIDLSDADFFALVGPTGSGKSTILDAVCFALYGTVPRWGDRRRIEHALAPSATEARVQLVFEASGARFVATRVVRRDGKGRVSTGQAGLEQLPAGFDLRAFDTAPGERAQAFGTELGTVLAGTPAEMDAAVRAAVGLPYEQFTSCVVLPQGEFARFLHAKPADRQEILVNLLGLHVYERIGERARATERHADTAAAATRGLLTGLTDADDAAQAAAEATLAAAHDLAARAAQALPTLADALTQANQAHDTLDRIDAELAALRAVREPSGVATLASTAATVRLAAADATAAVNAAEEREEKLRAELAMAGDAVAIQRMIDGYAERDRLRGQATERDAAVGAIRADHDRAGAELARAQARAESLAGQIARARRGVEEAQTADRAATLRPHLVAGQACPVCTQVVTTVPAMPAAPALGSARAALATVEADAQAADQRVARLDRALRGLDRDLAAATARQAQVREQLAGLDQRLAEAPPLATLTTDLARLGAAEAALAKAGEALRAARQAARAATTEVTRAEARLNTAWQDFDRVRDGLAGLGGLGGGPPAPDRDQLAEAWRALTRWAGEQAAHRHDGRNAAASRVREAEGMIETTHRELADMFAAARAAGVDVPPPSAAAPTGGPARASGSPAGLPEPGDYRHAAALGVERASLALRRLAERREQATQLAGQLAEHERDAQVARSLAQHLRSDRFERWLLTEALDALVAGASRILRELSSGQYDLVHAKGDLVVVDHTDAGLRRGVRTLSGGETFQASLALALALSEQLATWSNSAASLESIMLDEGFGTLDASNLETVAATLESLAARGDRMVGVVTHVPALAERIPVRFELHRDASGTVRIARVG